jgi:aminoglycoside phosphotransferase (APT) family kinase protein
VVGTRQTLLQGFIAGFDLHELPDPFAQLPDPFTRLPDLLNESVSGTQSTIHGDLNLENILVGPGGFVWLIDFAQTREGHPLYDFAHLEAEIIAHVIAAQVGEVLEYLSILEAALDSFYSSQADRSEALPSLLATLHEIAARCLFNPEQPREYQLALYMSCLGALKFANLNPFARHLLYLTAAYLASLL